MGAKRTEYQIVGRYMNGKEVTAYHLQSIETGKAGRYSREQVAYLVGRDQVTNCVGQIYQDKLLLRGKGMSLEDLPVQQEDGTLKRTDNIGKIRKGTSAANAMEQWMIVGTLKAGRNTVGYVVQNAGCGIKKVKRQQVIELAKVGKIGNARVQTYQGKELLRGVGVNLDELPSENINVTPTNNTTNDKGSQSKTKSLNGNNTSKNSSIAQREIIISIDTFKKNGEPYLINFNCKNKEHLVEFCKYLMNKIDQPFRHSGLNISQSKLGKNLYEICDIAIHPLGEYARLNEFEELTNKFKIRLVVLSDFVIIDANNGEPLADDDPEKKALTKYIMETCNACNISIIRGSNSRNNLNSKTIREKEIIISIDTFKANGEPYLVNFNCKNKEHLVGFCKYLMTKTDQQFECSGLEVFHSSIGKDFYALIDNGIYSLSKYKAIADEFKLRLVVSNEFDVVGENTGVSLESSPNRVKIMKYIISECKKLGIRIVKGIN